MRQFTYRVALEDVIRAIKCGAYPLPLDKKDEKTTENMLKKRYMASFSFLLKDGLEGYEKWEDDKRYVLHMANRVGVLAASLTTTWIALTRSVDTPGDYDPCIRGNKLSNDVIVREHADIAGYVVSKTLCRPGQYCMNYTFDGYRGNEPVVESLANYLVQAFLTCSKTPPPKRS